MNKYTLIYSVLVLLIFGLPYILNLNKLSNCDFESPYRCEVIHGIGIIPLVSMITVWFGTDEEK